MTKAPLTRYSLQAHRITSHVRDASAQRAAPGRAGKIYGNARRAQVYAKFCIFKIFGPCKNFVDKPTCHARGSSQLFGFAANSFSKFHWSMAPPNHNWLAKNPDCRNEFADFEKIDVEHPRTIIAKSANRWPNHPWHGITLQAHRSTNQLMKNRLFVHGVRPSFSASYQIHFRYFIDQWHHLNVYDSQKIRVVEINAQTSRKSTLTTEKLPTPWRPIDDKITHAPVLLCKLSALRVMSGRERAASGPRQGRKNTRKCSENDKSTQNFAFSKFLVHQKKCKKNDFSCTGFGSAFRLPNTSSFDISSINGTT